MRFSGSQSMREMDRIAIEELGIPGEVLMARAAEGAAEAARQMLRPEDHTVVLCGSGNNGGDGIGIAAMLLETGYRVSCIMVGDENKLSRDSQVMKHRLETAGGKLLPYSGPACVPADCSLIVDALFGTGLSREIGGKYATLIRLVNAMDVPVLSCDIPSGISADTGAVLGCAVKADVTVTFNLPKTGQLLPPGTEYCGRLVVHDIGIPEAARERVSHRGIYMQPPHLPDFPLESHKGSRGKLLMLCGSLGYTGAAAMASEAALRTGAGLIYLGVPEPVYPILAAKLTEPVVFPLPANAAGRLSLSGKDAILEKLPGMAACLAGPGLGNDQDTRSLVLALLSAADCPLILDADGLNVLSGQLEPIRLAARRIPVILTPHPGEFARLGGDPQKDRITGALELSARTGAVVVLKGYRTVTAAPDGRVYVNSTGNPGMATGGSGDVLSGILTCLVGQGMEPALASAAAVWIHGAAGDVCAERMGQRSMLPTDMIRALPDVLQPLGEKRR